MQVALEREDRLFHLILSQLFSSFMFGNVSIDPAKRPVIAKIRKVLVAVSSEMKRLADLTIVHTRTQIEQYKRNIVKNNEETLELTKELEETKIDFLTRWVYEAYQDGETIEPKFYQVRS